MPGVSSKAKLSVTERELGSKLSGCSGQRLRMLPYSTDGDTVDHSELSFYTYSRRRAEGRQNFSDESVESSSSF